MQPRKLKLAKMAIESARLARDEANGKEKEQSDVAEIGSSQYQG